MMHVYNFTFIRRSLKASKPASVHIAFISAPENSSLVITNSSKLTSSANVILDVCICISQRGCLVTSHKHRTDGTVANPVFACNNVILTVKMRLLVLISGSGNSIFLSILPGRSSAGSRVSILFVARITLTSPLESKPSSWFSSSNIVLWISRSPPEWASYLRSINH